MDDLRLRDINSGELLDLIGSAYDAADYPKEFTDRYVIIECLAERSGIDTFLVQKQVGSFDAQTFVAKCYDKSIWTIGTPENILEGLDHDGLPKMMESFENDTMIVTIREYIPGTTLDQYARDHDLSEQDVVSISVRLCDILSYLHHQPEQIIHRDIKPQNIIICPDGELALIDFDIARVYRSGRDTDTRFFGTIAYAPPEQYGFTQTDARADIYSFGVLLRYLLTGSPRENKKIQVYQPLSKIIHRCTAFAPERRYSDISQVRSALLKANPRTQRRHLVLMILCILAAAAVLALAGHRIYEKVTFDPFSEDAIPAYFSDEERIADAVNYMRETYDTDIFDQADDIASIGMLRAFLIDCYGMDQDYVYGYCKDIPKEQDDCFLPWGWDDKQTVDRDTVVYAAVKLHDPEFVADWSSLSDDNGEYPGTRVAMAFAEKTGIMTGVNRPDDLTIGEVALILANADRVFEAAEAAAD